MANESSNVIPPASNNLLKLLQMGPAGIRMMARAAGHFNLVPELPVQDDVQPIHIAASARKKAKEPTMTRGQMVRHKPSGKKVVILAAAVKTEGQVTYHRIHRSGKTWLVPESNLEPL